MDEIIKQRLLDKNKRIINMVIERAKRDFPDDIALIALTGSFSTGDFNEKSDLDLIIINNTDRGWGISSCFILDDIGYDIYCTPWKPRIEAQADLTSPVISCLASMEILYCAKPEYLDKFNSYKNRALEALAKPLGKESIERAEKYIDRAKQEYANTLLSESMSNVRHSAGKVLSNLTTALAHLNNTSFRRGTLRRLEEIAAFKYVPSDCDERYFAIIEARTIPEARNASYEMIKSIVQLCHKIRKEVLETPVPTYDNLEGTYEELWSNYRNKVIACAEANDRFFAFLVAIDAQTFLDEMTECLGTKKFELMKHFDPDNLQSLKEGFLQIMDEYLEEYNKVGRTIRKYDSLDQLYEHFMQSSQ